MTRDEMSNKLAQQINFVRFSGKDPKQAVKDMVKIADDYADARELAVRKELDFTGENSDTYDELEYSSRCPECLDRCSIDELEQFGGLCESCSMEGGERC